MIKQICTDYNAKDVENNVQQYWRSTNAYQKTKELGSNGYNIYFVDGPPYTTGAIHLGTAMNKTIKDIFIRYWRMKGYNVRDQPGFDMHGLPIEVRVEKNIGIHSKKDIESLGIDKFINICKNFSLDLHRQMTDQFKRLGIWMDWDNPYQTLKLDYIESAWWTLQCAYNKGLLRSASRVITWCPRCETALAEAEIEYWDEIDPSIIVRFPIKDKSVSLLIWTTTPWTLASNMAVAVHPQFEYAIVRMINDSKSEDVIILETQAESIMKKGGYNSFRVIKTMKGKDLEGLEYVPPFDLAEAPASQWSWKVVLADYVENDNTGLVHIAPGHGPDDYETGKKYGIYPFCPVSEDGRYTEQFPLFVGRKVKTVSAEIIKCISDKGILYHASKIKHRYGHCWRCKSTVIYRNTRQWFIDIPNIKNEMLSEIDRIRWIPNWSGESREKNWVKGAREWCISRQRYWGIPLPIWECTCGAKKIVGQYSELKGGNGYTDGMDTHRPWIDNVTFDCPICKGIMRRVPDVLDVWFDSGVAAWASLGYPQNKNEFERWWPVRFIVEAHDQTRGWFYSQLGAGIISFNRAPYDEVMMHGWVLDSKGQKMSKSLGNVVDPIEIINDVGADSLRYYLIKSNPPWEDISFQRDGPKNARKVINTYWNVAKFASTYMAMDQYDPEKFYFDNIHKYLHDEDLWIISKTERMKRSSTQFLESRELHKFARVLDEYIVEDLSRWYVCLVRDRSWSENENMNNDKSASYFSLYYAIMNTALVLAPVLPHVTEEIYQHMGGKFISIHMEKWPRYDQSLIDDNIEHSMDLIREIVDIIAAERSKMGSKLRWPLLQIFVCGNNATVNKSIDRFGAILSNQANVKDIIFIERNKISQIKNITPIKFSEGDIFIDFSVTPEIQAEGYSRELIRRIQQMRKDMQVDINKYIHCEVSVDADIMEMLDVWKDRISSEVRAKSLKFTDTPRGSNIKTWRVVGRDIVIGLSIN